MKRITRALPVALILSTLLLFAAGARAQGTYTAADCSRNSVNAVINGPTHTAVNGDTINIPAGSCTWTSGITVPGGIGISIIGAGAGSTTIIDNYTLSPSWLFYFRPGNGAFLSRISSMTLSPQSGLSQNSLSAPIAFQGTCTSSGCPNIRVDNLVFPATPSWGGLTTPSNTMLVTDNVFGVLDHNSLYSNSSAYYEFVNFNHSAWQGVGQYGDNSWASPDTFGTNQALYLEDNHFEQTGSASLFPITETEGGFGQTNEGGGRVVCRFNTGVGLRSMCVNHGTESNGRPRGGRQMEFYRNSMSCPSSSYPACFSNAMMMGAGVRSGSLLAIANSYTWGAGTGMNEFASISEYRALQSIGAFGPCDGSGHWDYNDSTVYFQGTIGAVSGSNPYTITVNATPGWTTNQWASHGSPYSLHDATTNNGSEITGSGSNTLNVTAWTSIAFGVGNSIQILRATACIDQSSRIGGSLLSGNPPTPTNTTQGHVYQSLDPVYEAADTGSGATAFGAMTSQPADRLIANRDYYSEVSQSAQSSPTSPFNGTVGTGYGTLANRPTTCTPRVGYWATDQGNWNQSGSGEQGQLYVCTATNTWTLYYTPYTYPHPLTGAVTAMAPGPPANLQATPQ
jgi:hypothetical protein